MPSFQIKKKNGLLSEMICILLRNINCLMFHTFLFSPFYSHLSLSFSHTFLSSNSLKLKKKTHLEVYFHIFFYVCFVFTLTSISKILWKMNDCIINYGILVFRSTEVISLNCMMLEYSLKKWIAFPWKYQDNT